MQPSHQYSYLMSWANITETLLSEQPLCSNCPQVVMVECLHQSVKTDITPIF